MDSDHVVAHLSGEAALPEPSPSNRYRGSSTTPTPPTAPHATPENKAEEEVVRPLPSTSSKTDADCVSVSGAASSSGKSATNSCMGFTWPTQT